MNKPDFWPANPYPEDIFPMKREDYPKLVPDDHQRGALSGMLGRHFWEVGSDMIWKALQEALESGEWPK
ncbi:unnamed protein product [marine sediment metagenome]|uniref:Uncharacterized protein n=1 Tax=marine sediment metagenome TaxID=412755 RepID=X1P6I4_9ZZZZ